MSAEDSAAPTNAPGASRRRWRPLLVVAAAAVVVVLGVVATLGVGVVQRVTARNAAQITPAGIDEQTLGYVVGAPDTGDSAPLVVLYEDFQCVLCQQANALYFTTLQGLADRGNIRLRIVEMTLWDAELSNNASTRAAIAVGCAAEVGAYLSYRQWLFATQAAPARQPWSDDSLRGDIAVAAGISGAQLTSFQICYTNQGARDFVKRVDERVATNSLVKGGPVITVNGKNPQVPVSGAPDVTTDWWKQLPDQQGAWMAAIQQAAAP